MGIVLDLEQVREHDDFKCIIDGCDHANSKGSHWAEPAVPGDKVDTLPFIRMQIDHLEFAWHNNQDEVFLWCWGRLKDGRWFCASGWADYTGWG